MCYELQCLIPLKRARGTVIAFSMKVFDSEGLGTPGMLDGVGVT